MIVTLFVPSDFFFILSSLPTLTLGRWWLFWDPNFQHGAILLGIRIVSSKEGDIWPLLSSTWPRAEDRSFRRTEVLIGQLSSELSIALQCSNRGLSGLRGSDRKWMFPSSSESSSVWGRAWFGESLRRVGCSCQSRPGSAWTLQVLGSAPTWQCPNW